jgi:hypothetical protein
MLRWVDVSPYSWYYRDVLDAGRLQLSMDDTKTLFESIPYNKFVTGQGRLVQSYISTEGQIEFALPGYIPSDSNPVLCFVDGVPVQVDTEPNKVFLPNPISAGMAVVVSASGTPDMVLDGCRVTPSLIHGGNYPGVILKHETEYVFNINYTLNENASAMGRKLRRIDLDRISGESIQEAMHRVVGYDRNLFTIEDGRLCTSFEFWNVPITIEYNYKGANGEIMHTVETLIPSSDVVVWNDRFFPDVVMNKAEFMTLLQRIRINLYNRFTDRDYEIIANNERNINDIGYGAWYSDGLLDILNEKFLDGCYVFPLYEDNSFNPTGCISRAEAVTYLHRFTEWSLERFR